MGIVGIIVSKVIIVSYLHFLTIYRNYDGSQFNAQMNQ